MFKILGSDGKEYGPVSADVLRQWIAERRAGAQTRIKAEGATDWKALADFSEFTATLATGPRSVPPPPPPLAGSAPLPGKTSGLAIASLVLGILGLCGITAILGLVLGIVAQVKISRSGGRLKGGGLAIAGICVSGAMLLLALPFMAGLFLPAFAKAKSKAQTISCVNNMKQIGLAVRLYAEDNNGQCPPAATWCDALLPSLQGPNVLQCPAQSGQQCSYGFNRSVVGRTLSSIPSDTVTVFEISGGWNVTGGQDALVSRSPHGRTFVIGFADGSVRQVSEDALQTLRWEP